MTQREDEKTVNYNLPKNAAMMGEQNDTNQYFNQQYYLGHYFNEATLGNIPLVKMAAF